MVSALRMALYGLVLMVLAACSGEDSSTQTATGESGSAIEREAVPGVDPDSKVIRLGALNAESGPAAAIGKAWAVGKRILAAEINQGNSGLLPDGWSIELVERDHGYNPQRSVQMFNEIRDDVLFLITSFGTPNTLPLRPMLERNEIVAFPASLSSKMAEFAYTPPFAPSYTIEAMRGMDWAVAAAGGADQVLAGVVYQQDDYGKDGLEGWRKAAAHHGVQLVAEETYAPGQADYTAAVSALKQAGATHVWLASLPSATGPLLGAAAQLDYQPVWIGNYPAWIDRFFDPDVIPPQVFDNFYLSSSVVYWGEDRPGMKQFLNLYETYGRDQTPPDTYILSSYIQGRMAIEGIRRAIEAGDLSRAGYLRSLQGITGYDADGTLPFRISLDTLPYVVGTETRVLKPDMANATWQQVAPYAAPQALN